VLETRQRGAVWLSFGVGAALSALLQLPAVERPGPVLPAGGGPAATALETTSAAQNIPLGTSIASTAMRHGLDPALVLAVIGAESGHDPLAVSPKGAIGLMQIKTQTARGLGYDGGAAGLKHPETNIRYGMKYLAAAHELGDGQTCSTILKYNAGHGAKRMNPVSKRYCGKVLALIAS